MPDYNKAKSLWQKANKMLDEANVQGYFKALDEYCKFMIDQKIDPPAMSEHLKDESISPKAWAVLEQVSDELNKYSLGATTVYESTIEAPFASAISMQSAFFLDSKLKKNEHSNPDPDFKLSRQEILLNTMQHILDVSEHNKKIGERHFKTILQEKMILLEAGGKNLSEETKEAIYAYKGELNDFVNILWQTQDEPDEKNLSKAEIDILVDLCQGVQKVMDENPNGLDAMVKEEIGFLIDDAVAKAQTVPITSGFKGIINTICSWIDKEPYYTKVSTNLDVISKFKRELNDIKTVDEDDFGDEFREGQNSTM